ncbi:MAG TPA: methyltransferase domain-containing protein [Candidatus Bathyarchaeia archaeon]|nr:methyltransferase domain-containing protein [Candidatus Bathyarchaeia archaeon]
MSNLAFRVKYLRRSREIWRRYLASKPWLDQLYLIFLDIRPGQKIVDVGCGPGDFTRYLAKLSKGRSKIIGIDSNPKSIKAAIADTKKARLSHVTSYKIGDVYKIPIDENYADLTCCRTLLMHLTDPLKAVQELSRITKPGGSVVAVELGKMSSFHDPNDEKFTRLVDEVWEAWVRGGRKLEGKDFRIGEKLPGIFQRAGLTSIKAEAQSDAYITSDPRREMNDVKAELRFSLLVFREQMKIDRKYVVAGGLSNAKINAYNKRFISKTETLLSDEQKLRTDPTISTSSLFIVSGMKKDLA